MGKVTFDDADPNLVSERYSQGRGSVLRSENIEVIRIRFAKGEKAAPHSHPEEQFTYILSGRLRVELPEKGETYEIGPGEATFNPSNIVHGVEALEDTIALSLKAPLSAEDYAATRTLA
jgi:quercetin dioxygenase-like cupin family protein